MKPRLEYKILEFESVVFFRFISRQKPIALDVVQNVHKVQFKVTLPVGPSKVTSGTAGLLCVHLGTGNAHR